MKNNFILLVLLLVLKNSYSFGQNREPQDNLLSSFNGTPNDGGSNSGSNINVDPYTGKAVVSFQLFSYSNQSTGVRHAVSLGYNGGGGIQADEVASNVGLGWSVNAALTITREVRGRPDDDFELGYEVTPPCVSGHPTMDSSRLHNIIKDYEDGELDNYHYNTPTGSGSFVIGKNGLIVTIPSTTFKIERLVNNSVSPAFLYFLVTDNNGIKFVYDVLSNIDIDYGTGIGHNISATTTWYVSKIISPFNTDTIFFDYDEHNLVYDGSFSMVRYDMQSSPNDYMAFRSHQSNIHDQRLINISYPNGDTLLFDYDTIKRLDLRSDNVLKSIVIKNRFSNSSYKYCFKYLYTKVEPGTNYKSILPYLDYEGSSEWAPEISPSSYIQNAENYYRLFLNNFHKESGADSINGYTFRYNNNHLNPRGGSRIDAWGFATGVGLWVGPQSPGPESGYDVLTHIYLPSGGSAEFVFEQNSAYDGSSDKDVGGVRVKKIVLSDGTGQLNNSVKEYVYEDNQSHSSGIIGNPPIYDLEYSETYIPAATPHAPEVPPSFPVDYYPYELVSYKANSSAVPSTTYVYDVKHSAPLNGMQYFQGSPVAYSRVEEYTGTKTSYKSKTVYEYSSAPIHIFGVFPYLPVNTKDYLNGLLKTVKNFNSSGILTKKDTFEYVVYTNDLIDSNFCSIKAASRFHPINYAFDTVNYYPTTAKVFCTKSIQTEYFALGDSVVTTTETEYDTAKMVPRIQTAADAKGVPVYTKYYYPFDFAISGALSVLQDKGIVYEPIRTEIHKQGSPYDLVVNGGVSTFDTANGVVHQSASYALTSTGPISLSIYPAFSSSELLPSGPPFTKLIQMDRYDFKANLLESTSKGVKTSKIWDYNFSLPVAEVVNAGVTEIAYTSFETNELGGWSFVGTGSYTSTSDSFTGRQCGVLPTTGSLSSIDLDNAKTYIVSCWCKQGAPGAEISISSGGSVYSFPLTLSASETHLGWTLYKASVSGAVKVHVFAPSSSNHLIDELRLYPLGAAMTTYTFDPLFGMRSVCNPANHTSYIEYDNFGRMKFQRDLDGNILKACEYKIMEPQY